MMVYLMVSDLQGSLLFLIQTPPMQKYLPLSKPPKKIDAPSKILECPLRKGSIWKKKAIVFHPSTFGPAVSSRECKVV